MKKKVLVVDDSEFDRNLTAHILRRKDFEVFLADSGAACFEFLKTEKPDVILMDIMMPKQFGSQVLLKIREKFNSIELPVIMMTARTETVDIMECLLLGANDYITKPVEFEIAAMRMLTHLKISDLSREMSKIKELEAVNAMITTYNHEINNPLAVALGSLRLNNGKMDVSSVERLERALWKIADIVKRISAIRDEGLIGYEDYTELSKMVKIKK